MKQNFLFAGALILVSSSTFLHSADASIESSAIFMVPYTESDRWFDDAKKMIDKVFADLPAIYRGDARLGEADSSYFMWVKKENGKPERLFICEPKQMNDYYGKDPGVYIGGGCVTDKTELDSRIRRSVFSYTGAYTNIHTPEPFLEIVSDLPRKFSEIAEFLGDKRISFTYRIHSVGIESQQKTSVEVIKLVDGQEQTSFTLFAEQPSTSKKHYGKELVFLDGEEVVKTFNIDINKKANVSLHTGYYQWRRDDDESVAAEKLNYQNFRRAYLWDHLGQQMAKHFSLRRVSARPGATKQPANQEIKAKADETKATGWFSSWF